MLINDDSDDEGGAAGGEPMEEDLAGRAYQDQLTSTEGMRRGAGGRVVFNKDTKRGREREAEGDVTVSSISLFFFSSLRVSSSEPCSFVLCRWPTLPTERVETRSPRGTSTSRSRSEESSRPRFVLFLLLHIFQSPPKASSLPILLSRASGEPEDPL